LRLNTPSQKRALDSPSVIAKHQSAAASVSST
jgi:hypothetical protein